MLFGEGVLLVFVTQDNLRQVYTFIDNLELFVHAVRKSSVPSR